MVLMVDKNILVKDLVKSRADWTLNECLENLRWLNTVLRAFSGNSRDGECFNLDKQTWRRKSNGKQKTISQNLLIKIL